MNLQLLAKISLIFFLYVLVYYFFVGIATKPTEGDSLAYHIPIAKSIVNGSFLHPHYTNDHEYFPGSFETILAGFMLLHIPLNLYNVLAIVVLFFAAKYLGTVFGLQKWYAIIFAATICTLNVILRWANAQTVDIWLGVFYVFALALLEKPQKKVWYYVLLGITAGMLIGTKYSGPLFIIALLLVYGKNFVKYLSLKRLIVFLIPVVALGFFWYVRNYFVIGNPFYPLDTPFFKGIKGNPIIEIPIWKALLGYPMSMLNAFLGEYMLWSVSIIVVPVFLVYQMLKKQIKSLSSIKSLCLLSAINLVIFLFLPSDSSYQIHVSQFRFTYPVFIPLILSVFIVAKEYKKGEALSLIAIANMFTLPSLSYHPKLLLIYIPLVYFVIFPQTLLKLVKSFKF